MQKTVDYLIIGQGLAGTFLAFQLLKRNKSFLVIDNGHKSSSSLIAAGIINPVVLRRYTKSWRADNFLKYNTECYKELNSFLKKKYHFSIPIDKLITSDDELNFWQHRFEKADLKDYLEKNLKNVESTLINAVKVGRVKQSSWLNISELLIDFKNYLIENDLILQENFSFSSLNSKNYKEFFFEKIVFCEGAKSINNPFFNYLPFSLNKGQLMTIKTKKNLSRTILKKKVFILPFSNYHYKVGATYSWSWEDEKIEPSKTSLLKEQLEEIINVDYEIEKEEVGIRPAVKDRRPLLGRHPENSNYFIFNGLGSKGCFMAPLLSNELVDFIESGKELPSESNISRFKLS